MKNLISWVEIPAMNFERAVKFYSEILDLEFEVADFGDEKMACFPGGEGAISQAPDFNPSCDGVLVSLNAEKNLDIVLEKIEKAGGKITQPKTKIEAEGRGFFALFKDSEGNRLGLYGDK